MQSQICSNCQKENPGDMFFCMDCGTGLPKSVLSELPTLATRGTDPTRILGGHREKGASEVVGSQGNSAERSVRIRTVLVSVGAFVVVLTLVVFGVLQYGNPVQESQGPPSKAKLNIEIRSDWEAHLKKDLTDSPPTYFPHAIESRSLYFREPTGGINFEFHAALFASAAEALDCYNGFAVRNNLQKAEGMSDPLGTLMSRKSGDSYMYHFVSLGQPDNRPIITVTSSSNFERLPQLPGIVKVVD